MSLSSLSPFTSRFSSKVGVPRDNTVWTYLPSVPSRSGTLSRLCRALHSTITTMPAGLKTVILLSFVLAVGFLLIILSCALWQNWLPLLVALIFVLAPLPNALFSHCGSDEFSASYEGGGPIDLGRFLTSMVVVTGFALPIVLAHSSIITTSACIMSILGGSLVYGTILAYSAAFKQDDSEF